MSKKIDLRLFPDVKVEGEGYYITDVENGIPPIVKVVSEENGEFKKGTYLITGEGSIGKSTSMLYLRYLLLKEGKPFYYQNLKLLNSENYNNFIRDMDNIAMRDDVIVLFDAYDEIYVDNTEIQEKIKEILEANKNGDKLIVITSRNKIFDEDSDLIKNKIKVATIQRLTEEQVKGFVTGADVLNNSRLMYLMQNTMFLSLYLEMKDKGDAKDLENVKNEVTFLDWYFKSLGNEKSKANNCQYDVTSDLKSIGKIVYKNQCREQIDDTDDAYINHIDDYLNNIFTLNTVHGKKVIDSVHLKYLCFAYAKHYFSVLCEYGVKSIEFNRIKLQSKDYLDAVYYIGQMLQEVKQPKQDELVKFFYKKALKQPNDELLTLLLGYTNGMVDSDHYILFINDDYANDFLNDIDYYASYITHVKIPKGVIEIGNMKFSACSSLVNVEIPNSVECIGMLAFGACNSLTSINVAENNQNYKSIDGNLYSKDGQTLIQYAIGKKNTSFIIPNSVKCIGLDAFSFCRSLTSVEMPNGVIEICDTAFDACNSLTSINVAENNQNYKSIDGNLYSKDGKTLIHYAIGKKNTSFIIPNSVECIGFGAFSGCSSLTSVEIPNSVKSIGGRAFALCKNLKMVKIPNSIECIGTLAFDACNSLTSVEMPNGVKIIGEDAFSSCRSLASITFKGTMAEWKALVKGDSLLNFKVCCTDGDIDCEYY